MESVVDISPFPCPAVSTPRETSMASTIWAVDLWPHALARGVHRSTDERLIQMDQYNYFFPDFKIATQELHLISLEIKIYKTGTRAAMFASYLNGTEKGTLQKWEDETDLLREAEKSSQGEGKGGEEK